VKKYKYAIIDWTAFSKSLVTLLRRIYVTFPGHFLTPHLRRFHVSAFMSFFPVRLLTLTRLKEGIILFAAKRGGEMK
jgi:hypothetical protein